MRVFNYSFLNNGLLPANLVNLTSSIVSLKTMAGVRKDEYAQVFTELESIAKVQSVKSSNAIEGIVTSDERIHAIVNQNSTPLNHNEAEIAGYRDALNTIHLSYEHIDFRQSDILRLHEMMMSIAGYEYGGRRRRSAEGSFPANTCRRNAPGDGTTGISLYGGQKRLQYQPASAYSLRNSGLSLYSSIS